MRDKNGVPATNGNWVPLLSRLVDVSRKGIGMLGEHRDARLRRLAGLALSAMALTACAGQVGSDDNTSPTPLSLYSSGAAPCSLTPWVTSEADTLAAKTMAAVSSSRVSVTLGAQSVTTLVGKP